MAMVLSRKWKRMQCLAYCAFGVGSAAVLFDATNDAVLSRSMRTVFNALRVGYLYKTTNPETPEDLSKLHATAAGIILNTCLTNEGLYIKLGQGISAFNHILPEEFTETLKVLLDRAPGVSLEDVRRIFQEETGRNDFTDVFAAFDETPVASASIAQVHKAKMRLDDGRLVDVAVKVQKPKIRKQIWWDLQCYFFVCRLLQFAFDLPLMWSAKTIAENLTKEIDFENEAANSLKARRLLAGRHDVYVPLVYEQLSTKRLIVAEWIDAVKLLDINTVKALYNTNDVMTTVLESFGAMIFEHGFVHCDPHPANLMIRPNTNPRNKKPFEAVVIDFGLCVDETEKFRLEYALLFKSIFTGDRTTLVDIVRSWGIGNADLFASLTIQKPFTSSKPVHSAGVTKEDIQRMEMLMKEHVKTLLQREELIPQELVFVGRSMNLLRALNKSYGAPVNRVNLLAGCAVKGLRHLSTFDDVRRSVGGCSNDGPLRPRKRDFLRGVLLELHFRWTLSWISIVHVCTQWYNTWVAIVLPRHWAEACRVGNLEEQLERKEKEMIAGVKLSSSSQEGVGGHNGGSTSTASNDRTIRFHPPMRIAAND